MERFSHISRADLIARAKTVFTRKRLLIAGGVILGVLIVTPIVTYAVYAHDISNRDRLMNRNDTGIVLKDRNGKVFYEFGNVSANDNLPLSQISPDMQHAVIAAEDHNFYSEPGFSIKGTVSAAYADLIHRSATYHGGSTITQQLVKNKLLSSNKNFFRKYQEISMAIAVDKRYSKNDILDMYLNSAYFGDGAFGVSEAAKTYFNKTPSQLSLAQSSMLAGLLPAPSAYSPVTGSKQLAQQRQHYVLDQMVKNHYISSAQRSTAENTTLTYVDGTTSTQDHAQHFAQMVLDQLKQKYGEEKATRGGYVVTTTLDLGWQKTAEQIVKQRVAITASRGGRNASLVAEDPQTGEVRALVGSVDWNNPNFGQVNMATTPRQPGSSFKPIYYSKAMDDHLITPATILDDSKITFGKNYTPKDYDNQYKGKMPVRNALAESRNVPAVEVMQKLGVQNAIDAAHEMGLNTIKGSASDYGLSLALGTAEVRLVDMVNAYSAFANQGNEPTQTLITHVQNKYGKTVFKSKPQTHQVRSAGASFLISSILSDTTARAPTYGTSLNIYDGRQFAFKTGTTNDNKDAWTIGFTPNLVIGAWVGNNEHQPMIGLAGGSAAGVIWKETMSKLITNLPKQSFTPPSSVVQLNICRGTDQRAPSSGYNTYKEYFLKGTEPTSTCDVQQHIQTTPSKPTPQPQTQPVKPTAPAPANNPNPAPNTNTQNPTPPPTDQGGGTGTGGTGGDTTTPPPGSGGDQGGGGTQPTPPPQPQPTNPTTSPAQ